MTKPKDAPVIIDPFMADIMTSMMSQTQAVTNSVISTLEERAEMAEAELEMLYAQLNELFDQPWAPSEKSIRRAMFLSREAVKKYVEENRVSY